MHRLILLIRKCLSKEFKIFNFRGQHQKYPYSFKSDMYSSGIKGISPDAFVIGRINSNNDINDSLKNTVKTIMFSDNYNKSNPSSKYIKFNPRLPV